jgi:hypothetical protein
MSSYITTTSNLQQELYELSGVTFSTMLNVMLYSWSHIKIQRFRPPPV